MPQLASKHQLKKGSFFIQTPKHCPELYLYSPIRFSKMIDNDPATHAILDIVKTSLDVNFNLITEEVFLDIQKVFDIVSTQHSADQTRTLWHL